jgi:hypothetical protein
MANDPRLAIARLSSSQFASRQAGRFGLLVKTR